MARTGAAATARKTFPARRASDRFLDGLKDASSVSLVSHVNPDPDSLGSMLGLAHLIDTRLGLPVRMTRDGLISRAENRAMVELLDIDLVALESVARTPGEAIVMVDSQPSTGRHSLPDDIPLSAVIDHHETSGDVSTARFIDLRPDLGATCSIVTSYLMEQDIPVTERIATGMLYGIETELCGYPREASSLDDSALLYLYPLANKDRISQIRNARVPLPFYECILAALQNSFRYDRLIVSWVNELAQPELAAEVVDFLIRFEEVDWAVCGGVYENQLVLSVRSSKTGAAAGEMLREVVGQRGKAGGHDRRAGGVIHLTTTSVTAIEQLQSELRRRLLKTLRIEEHRGQRLVPRREMLQNIQA